MSLTGLLEVVQDFGVSHVDLFYDFFEGMSADGIASFMRDLDNRDMDCNLLNVNSDLCNPDEAARDVEMQRLSAAVELAGEIGCPNLRIVAGPDRPEQDRALGIDLVVSAIEQLVEISEPKGLHLVIENTLREYGWPEQHFAMKSPVFLAIWERIRRFDVKVLFNTAAFLYSRDGGAWVLKIVTPSLFGVRLLDRCSPETDEGIELGHGCLKLPDLFRFLKQSGFGGAITADYVGPHGLAGLRRSFEYARQVWSAIRAT